MNCRINYLYERFPNNPDFAAHLEKIELEIWNTLKNEGFPRFQYEGVNYFTLSPKMSKEYKQQMKVLQSLRDKFGSTELFLMKKIAPFDYSLIQVGIGKIEEVQRKIFEENKISNKGQDNVIIRETFNEDAFDKFQKMKSVENNQKQSPSLTTEQTNQIQKSNNEDYEDSISCFI